MPAAFLRTADRIDSGNGSVEHPGLQKRKAAPAVHLALDELEPVDLPLDGAVAPFVLQRCADGGQVTAQTAGKAFHGAKATGARRRDSAELEHWLAAAHQSDEALHQVDQL